MNNEETITMAEFMGKVSPHIAWSIRKIEGQAKEEYDQGNDCIFIVGNEIYRITKKSIGAYFKEQKKENGQV